MRASFGGNEEPLYAAVHRPLGLKDGELDEYSSPCSNKPMHFRSFPLWTCAALANWTGLYTTWHKMANANPEKQGLAS